MRLLRVMGTWIGSLRRRGPKMYVKPMACAHGGSAARATHGETGTHVVDGLDEGHLLVGQLLDLVDELCPGGEHKPAVEDRDLEQPALVLQGARLDARVPRGLCTHLGVRAPEQLRRAEDEVVRAPEREDRQARAALRGDVPQLVAGAAALAPRHERRGRD